MKESERVRERSERVRVRERESEGERERGRREEGYLAAVSMCSLIAVVTQEQQILILSTVAHLTELRERESVRV